jgi:hypothetical protein
MKNKRSNEYDNQTMQNEKHIICINDEIEVDQVMKEREIPSSQIKNNIIVKECDKTDEKKTKHFCNIYIFKGKKWHPHNKNVIYWSFYFVNDK